MLNNVWDREGSSIIVLTTYILSSVHTVIKVVLYYLVGFDSCMSSYLFRKLGNRYVSM